MWKHKTKWLVRGGRKVRCYLCGKKVLAKGDLFLFHQDTGYYSHQSCQAESTTISGNERRRAVKKIAVGAAVVGAIAAGAGKLVDISSQSKGSNSPAAQTILTSQGLIPPALTSDPANPVPGQMWYRSDAGVEAHFNGVQNRVVYSSEINDGNVHVTSKGIVNGLSVLPNDGTGWFGPDTTKGATAPGQYGGTYTVTSGINESFGYVASIQNAPTGYEIQLGTGTFNISVALQMPNANISLRGTSWRYGSYIVATAAMTDMIILGTGQVIIENMAFSGGSNATYILNPTQSGDSAVILSNITYNTVVTGFFDSTSAINTTMLVYNLYEIGTTTYAINLLNYSYTIFVNGMFNSPCVFGESSGGGGITHLIGGGYFGGITNYTTLYATNIDLHELAAGDYSLTINKNSTTYIVNSRLKTANGSSSLIYDNGGLLMIDHTSYNLDGSGSYTQYMIHRVADANPSSVIVIKGLSVYSSVGSGDTVVLDITDHISTNSSTVIETVYTLPSVGSFVMNYPLLNLTANPPVSGTTYQNTNPNNIRLKIPVTYSPTSSAAATLATGISDSSTVTTSTKVSYPAGITTGIIETYEMVVPAGQYYELVVTNATIGTVEVQIA